jgi:hydrophobic/amphiphilic exporter-1 (mainly G- bacteria), HAE1 family
LTWLTRMALRNRSVTVLAVLALIVLSVIAITQLTEELMPNISMPTVTVSVLEPGAAPNSVAENVTTPLETALRGVEDVDTVTSYSNAGMSIVTVQFQYGKDIKEATSAVEEAVSGVQGSLPSDAQSASIKAMSMSEMAVVELAASSKLSPREFNYRLDRTVAPELEKIDGVGDVSISGTRTVQVDVKIKPKALSRHDLTTTQVLSALQGLGNATSVGSLTDDGTTFPVKIAGGVETVDQIKHLYIATQASSTSSSASSAASALSSLSSSAAAALSGMSLSASSGSSAAASSTAAGATQTTTKLVRLDKVADVRIVSLQSSSVTKTDGVTTAGVSITKSSSGNTVNISNDVKDLLPTLTSDLGPGAKVTVVSDQAPSISSSISSMVREGLIGAVFAILVILLFLRSWRSTIIAGLSIPLSVLAALVIMWTRGTSLNILTLGGLTIAIGRIIDDSIVVNENAFRHIQEGDDVHTAILTATKEVVGAITTSTIATVAVFLPLAFTSGLAGQFFRPFALTVTYALLASLVVALTVVPVASTWLLTKRSVGTRDRDKLTLLQRLYVPVLRWTLAHKAVTLIFAFVLFVGSMMLAPNLKTNLMGDQPSTTVSVTQSLPAGTSLDKTIVAADKTAEVIADTDGVKLHQMTVGSTGSLFGAGGGAGASSSTAQFTVTTTDESKQDAVVEALRSSLHSGGDAGDITVEKSSGMGMDTSGVSVTISGDSEDQLRKANDVVVGAMKSVSGIVNVSSNLTESQPELVVTVKRKKAAQLGVDVSSVQQIALVALAGQSVGTIETDSGTLDVVAKLQRDSGSAASQMRALKVPSSSGTVRLGTVATVKTVPGPTQVTHIDGERTITVSGSTSGDSVGTASSDVKSALRKVTLPEGTTWEMSGTASMMGDVFTSLFTAIALAVMLVYIIMVAFFRSVLKPIILMVSIPFAVVGAILLLLATSTTVGMSTLIGLLMLVGIVVTNAIVLLDLIEQYRQRGWDARSAVIEGSRRRMRPILMTAAATILALTPMALGLSEGAFLSTPLAVVVIGGLLSSTVLTLVIVPVLYLAFDRFIGGRRHDAALASAEAGGSSPS